MKKLSIDDLDSYVAFVDSECNGNLKDPRVSEKYLPVQLVYQTAVDDSIDPFSEEYFRSQIDLYEEIAGKKLNQWAGELHPVDIPSLLESPNPLGFNNPNFIAEHVRTLSTMLSLSCLGSDASVLDLGAGHGLSSEIYAFCGCHVHAIDIDPALSELATRRAAARSLNIKRSIMNFDSLSAIENDAYEAAFFFQSLHHCLRPWELIVEVARKLTPNGVIAFGGEPVQDDWWRCWGIRLDQESLYVARKFGWFESGWSRSFISDCFKKNGLTLVLFNNGLRGSLIGITSKDADKLSQIIDNAASLGFTPLGDGEIENIVQNYHSQIGKFARNAHGPTLLANVDHGSGFLCYGPYFSLSAGRYRASFVLRFVSSANGKGNTTASVMFDVIGNDNQQSFYMETITVNKDILRLVSADFELGSTTTRLEARVNVPESKEIWEMSLPVFERIASLDSA